ncbi:hypothetical protein ACJMK2_036583 [Sinanodonta woodiana]|uniref:ADP-ribosylation factor-like protein n=1 Tax=Sinanodonta woodiana TaxID=1069815 RepID=A0ABD3WHN3_SINWO
MEYRILMLGLDQSGKSSILYKLKLDENLMLIPTIGFNRENIKTENGVSLTVWDVGGQEEIRNLWTHYLQNTDGLIYVVDSAHRQSIHVSARELHNICDKEEMRGVPLLVMANKQDLPDQMNEAELVSALNLGKMNDRKWKVKGTSVITGDGLSEAIEMLASLVIEHRAGATSNSNAERDL